MFLEDLVFIIVIPDSIDSIIKEIEAIRDTSANFTGHISDLGGPTANMWKARCEANPETCRRPDCLFPGKCRFFKTEEAQAAALLETLSQIHGVRHLRVASGIRYDLFEKNSIYLKKLVRNFVGGHLKVAPEHCSEHVLRLMRKPPFEQFERFLVQFREESERAGKEQYLVPYLISAFPGCTDEDMRSLARWLREKGWKPQQVQCFIPTPGTVATAMFYAGVDTAGNKIFVARTDAERMRQHKILVGGNRGWGNRNRKNRHGKRQRNPDRVTKRKG